MTAFTSALTRWVETLANESAHLDPLTRKRLRALAGHSIAIELSPPAETTTLQFDGDSIRLSAGPIDAPSVIVRGTPSALAAAFIGANGGRSAVTIEGDEVVLGQFRGIIRDFRFDVFAPLEGIVGKSAADAITSVFEIALATLSVIGRGLSDEGGRLAREGVRQIYLTAPEFESFIDSVRALRLRVDRLNVRTDVIERAHSGEESHDE